MAVKRVDYPATTGKLRFSLSQERQVCERLEAAAKRLVELAREMNDRYCIDDDSLPAREWQAWSDAIDEADYAASSSGRLGREKIEDIKAYEGE